MLSNLTIVHRLKPRIFDPSTVNLVWSTCLRSLAFGEVKIFDEDDQLFRDRSAYEFLLEVICGLHSPILGETEVLGQFKVFSEHWLSSEPHRQSLIQRLQADAKEIRTSYLCGLGVQSYGSWVRKHLASRELHILGAGQLAQEICTYANKAADQVKTYSRTQMAKEKFSSGSLVVAAPVTSEFIGAWLDGRLPVQIFDMRETAIIDRLQVDCEIHRLQDIFSQIEQTKKNLLPLVAKVKNEISKKSEQVASSSIIRPMGWDDLCA